MSKKNNTTETVTFTIEQTLAKLRTSPAGWTREFNIVKWGDRDPVYDVRDWNPEHTKMGRGLAFTEAELLALAEAVVTNLVGKKAPAKKKATTKKAEPAKEEQVEMQETKEEAKPKSRKTSTKKADK